MLPPVSHVAGLPAETNAAAAAPPARLLVIEDDRELRSLLACGLRQDGHEVVELASGIEFLEYLETRIYLGRRDRPADLVVSDLRMPVFSGFDILGALRSISWDMPVIVITAFGDIDTYATALGLGAVAVFDKPFDVRDLRAFVRETLRNRRGA